MSFFNIRHSCKRLRVSYVWKHAELSIQARKSCFNGRINTSMRFYTGGSENSEKRVVKRHPYDYSSTKITLSI